MPERLLSIAMLVALALACSDADPSEAEGGDAAGGHGASAGSFGAGGEAEAAEEDSGPPLPRGENGTAGWKPEDFREALKNGIRPDLLGLCPPMPSGRAGAYGGMTSADARDIGHYFGSLEPRDNGEIPICCSACHKPAETP